MPTLVQEITGGRRMRKYEGVYQTNNPESIKYCNVHYSKGLRMYALIWGREYTENARKVFFFPREMGQYLDYKGYVRQ